MEKPWKAIKFSKDFLEKMRKLVALRKEFNDLESELEHHIEERYKKEAGIEVETVNMLWGDNLEWFETYDGGKMLKNDVRLQNALRDLIKDTIEEQVGY